MTYEPRISVYFPSAAIECGRIVEEYSSHRKIFPEGAIEAGKLLEEFSNRRQSTVESKAF